jgi:Tfp pilus assembly protein PilF
LGIIYHRVPKFISFRDDKKSEEYFKKAVATSSNLDTNWRYGEFLIDTGRKEQGLELLKTALTKLKPTKFDEKIKEKIIQGLIKKYESQ